MKYYEIYRSDQQSTQRLYATFTNLDLYDHISLIKGEEITVNFKTPLQYTMAREGKAKTFFPEKLEYIRINGGGILIHNRAKKIFASLTKHHTMYKSEIEYLGEQLPGPYFTINLETLYPAADLDKSDCYKDTIRGEEHILSIDRLVLSQKKLDQIPKDEHLFRLAEFTPITIVDEVGKNLIEEAKITGVEFTELEVAL